MYKLPPPSILDSKIKSSIREAVDAHKPGQAICAWFDYFSSLRPPAASYQLNLYFGG
jgi:hypothetical protein